MPQALLVNLSVAVHGERLWCRAHHQARMAQLDARRILDDHFRSQSTDRSDEVRTTTVQFGVTTRGHTVSDNDNDTLREVPHPSNGGLTLRARV